MRGMVRRVTRIERLFLRGHSLSVVSVWRCLLLPAFDDTCIARQREREEDVATEKAAKADSPAAKRVKVRHFQGRL